MPKAQKDMQHNRINILNIAKVDFKYSFINANMSNTKLQVENATMVANTNQNLIKGLSM